MLSDHQDSSFNTSEDDSIDKNETKAKNSFSSYTSCSTTATIVIPSAHWALCKPLPRRPGKRLCLNKGWTNYFSEALSKNPRVCHCTLNGKFNSVRAVYKHDHNYSTPGIISATILCSNHSTEGISCPVSVKLHSRKIVAGGFATFHATICGIANHTDVRSRQLRGERRVIEASKCLYTPPSQRHFELVGEVSLNSPISANVPSISQLRKAKSEMKCKNRDGSDVFASIMQQQKSMQPAFIRSLSIIPFRCVMWSDGMLQCYKKTCKLYGRQTLFLDATGCIVKKILDQKGEVFASSLVLKHVVEGEQQIPVAIMLSNFHDTVNYTTFLQQWWLSISKISVPLPGAVVVDWNWPSIHAVCLVFNAMNIVNYLKVAKDIVEQRLQNNVIKNLTVIGLGKAHLIRDMTLWSEVNGNKGVQRSVTHFWKCALAGLLILQDWKKAKLYVHHLLKMLRTKDKSQCIDSIDFVANCISDDVAEVNNILHRPSNTSIEETVHSYYFPIHHNDTLYKQSPFYQEACMILHNLEKRNNDEVCSDIEEHDINLYFNTPLSNRLVKEILPYLPMVSSILWNPSRYAVDYEQSKHKKEDFHHG